MYSTAERALSPARPSRGGSALGPVSRPGRDLAIALAVVAVLVALVRARAGVEYPLPVSIGNATVENSAEVLADAEARLQELAASQGGRIAEEAACYFWRPLGSTQGAASTDMLGSLGSMFGDSEAVDIVLCGPAELTPTGFMEGLPAGEPWVSGIVGYVPGSSEGTYRGELQNLLQMPLATLTATGGVQADTLLAADGRSPDAGVLDDPTWVEVEGSGEGDGGGLPPGISIPELPDLPDLDDMPELPDIPSLPGSEAP